MEQQQSKNRASFDEDHSNHNRGSFDEDYLSENRTKLQINDLISSGVLTHSEN